jgi:4-oxalocrotonate tautomerase
METEPMPHVIVKLYPGRTEEQKMRLTEEIVRDVVEIAKCAEKSVSVAFVDVAPEEWAEKVYKPDILESGAKLFKEPGYNPFK